jgi:hypothetical protein
MRRSAIILIILSVSAVLVACGDGRHKKPLYANEELRISAGEIEAYRRRAQDGDADAAKKLWHHYTFVEGDLSEGRKWKNLYDDLATKDRQGPRH